MKRPRRLAKSIYSAKFREEIASVGTGELLTCKVEYNHINGSVKVKLLFKGPRYEQSSEEIPKFDSAVAARVNRAGLYLLSIEKPPAGIEAFKCEALLPMNQDADADPRVALLFQKLLIGMEDVAPQVEVMRFYEVRVSRLGKALWISEGEWMAEQVQIPAGWQPGAPSGPYFAKRSTRAGWQTIQYYDEESFLLYSGSGPGFRGTLLQVVEEAKRLAQIE